MQKLVFTILFFFLNQFIVFGNDSTLYQKRVVRIQTLLEWLKESPHKQGERVISDTFLMRKSVDTAINLFFDKKYLSEKYYPKENLYQLTLRPIILAEGLTFRRPEPSRDTLIIDASKYESYFSNTVILYCPIYDLEFECFYFAFADNKTDLIYFMQGSGEPAERLEKKTFINNLQKKKTR